MSCRITTSEDVERRMKRLAKKYRSMKQDYALLLASLTENPFQGADLGQGLRKVRMAIASKGKGKSGGARVITYNVLLAATDTEVRLLYIYDKSERETITDAEIQALKIANGIE